MGQRVLDIVAWPEACVSDLIEVAVKIADCLQRPVRFLFDCLQTVVWPEDTYESVAKRWERAVARRELARRLTS